MQSRREILKLIQVTRYIAKQYLEILTFSREARQFFTDLYVKYVLRRMKYQPGMSERILQVPVGDLFPGIGSSLVSTYGIFSFLSGGPFSEQSGLLVSGSEILSLAALVKFLAPKTILEIGTFRGVTTSVLALNAPKGARICTLDIAPQDLEDPIVRDCFSRYRIERIQADSTRFDYGSSDLRPDFVFIDGDHGEDAVRKDTRNVLQFLSPGGTIVWHDYNVRHPGVVKVLHELASEIPVFHLAGTQLAVYSRGVR